MVKIIGVTNDVVHSSACCHCFMTCVTFVEVAYFVCFYKDVLNPLMTVTTERPSRPNVLACPSFATDTLHQLNAVF